MKEFIRFLAKSMVLAEAIGIFVLFAFYLVPFGEVLVVEHNKLVAWTELGLAIFTLAYAVVIWWKEVRKFKK